MLEPNTPAGIAAFAPVLESSWTRGKFNVSACSRPRTARRRWRCDSCCESPHVSNSVIGGVGYTAMDRAASASSGNAAEAKAELDTVSGRIAITLGVAGGKPRIAGHRITVQDIVNWHECLNVSAGKFA